MSVSIRRLRLPLLLPLLVAVAACSTSERPVLATPAPDAIAASTLVAALPQDAALTPEGSEPAHADAAPVEEPAVSAGSGDMYRELMDGGFKIRAVNAATMKPSHIRQLVSYDTREKPGSIIVDQKARYLYYVMPGGKAMRYAVGVGPTARGFNGGNAVIARKAAWPRWTPTADMVKRSPKHYGRYKDGVAGGIGNPMGARALYMHKDGVDTLYRVHGTNDPSSIGKAVSAGCIRLLNQDIIDLYGRVTPGARIVVL